MEADVNPKRKYELVVVGADKDENRKRGTCVAAPEGEAVLGRRASVALQEEAEEEEGGRGRGRKCLLLPPLGLYRWVPPGRLRPLRAPPSHLKSPLCTIHPHPASALTLWCTLTLTLPSATHTLHSTHTLPPQLPTSYLLYLLPTAL